jgi:hypothetical protein
MHCVSTDILNFLEFTMRKYLLFLSVIVIIITIMGPVPHHQTQLQKSNAAQTQSNDCVNSYTVFMQANKDLYEGKLDDWEAIAIKEVCVYLFRWQNWQPDCHVTFYQQNYMMWDYRVHKYMAKFPKQKLMDFSYYVNAAGFVGLQFAGDNIYLYKMDEGVNPEINFYPDNVNFAVPAEQKYYHNIDSTAIPQLVYHEKLDTANFPPGMIKDEKQALPLYQLIQESDNIPLNWYWCGHAQPPVHVDNLEPGAIEIISSIISGKPDCPE